jgi:hypothetical protein
VVWRVVCHVSCVVVPGAGRGGLLSWAGVLCDVVAGVGQCEHGGGVRTMHLYLTHLFYGLLGVDGSREVVGDEQGVVEDDVDG